MSESSSGEDDTLAQQEGGFEGCHQTVISPTPQEVQEVISLATDREFFITVFARCRASYNGRAGSDMEWGDRLTIIKPDGTVLLHKHSGYSPANWNTSDSINTVTIEEGRAKVTSVNGEDVLEIVFKDVIQVVVFESEKRAELALAGSEEDMREELLEEPSLIEAGFTVRATERSTSAGAIDLFGVDRNGTITAVELKRTKVGPDAVGQLSRYVEALENELHQGASVRGILIAPSVTDRANDLLEKKGYTLVNFSPSF
jgi:RecB family endonuclease NucS